MPFAKGVCRNPSVCRNHGSQRPTSQKVSDAFVAKCKINFPGIDLEIGDYLCLSCKSQLIKKKKNPRGFQIKKKATSVFVPEPAAAGNANEPTLPTSESVMQEVEFAGGSDTPNTTSDRCTSSESRMYPALQPRNLFEAPKESSSESQESITVPSSTEADMDVSSSKSSDSDTRQMRIEDVNFMLKATTGKPLIPSRATSSKLSALYQTTKDVIKDKFGKICKETVETPKARRHCRDCKALVIGLIDKFTNVEQRHDRMRILTCTPLSMTAENLLSSFNCSVYESRKATTLKRSLGPYSQIADARGGFSLSVDLKKRVVDFYNDDDISRPNPSVREVRKRKDPITGEKKDVARRYILGTLREIYRLYLKGHPTDQISISSFRMLRPKECCWPNHNGFHNTCTCVYHENFSLMLSVISAGKKIGEFVDSIVCKDGNSNCYLGYCDKCPKLEVVNSCFDAIETDNVEFYQWQKVDRTTFDCIQESLDSFQERFTNFVPIIVQHHYIAKRQGDFIKKLKEDIIKQERSAVVNLDFGQNYSFVIQDAVQGFHWSHQQATIHPFVVHWYDEASEKVTFKTYFFISDTRSHDATTVHVFQRKFIEALKKDLPFITKIYYVSDGTSAQYKNRYNMYYLMKHFELFGIEAEWHFTATSHGKSTCDAMSAVVKSATRRECLKKVGEKINIFAIQTAKEMYDFCVKKFVEDVNLQLFYVSDEVISHFTTENTSDRINAKAIPGIRKYHKFVPQNNGCLEMKEFSSSLKATTMKYFQKAVVLPSRPIVKVGNYVTFVGNRSCQLGLVLSIVGDDISLQLMKRSNKENVFHWPNIDKIINVPECDILCVVQPPGITSTGRWYNLSKEDYANSVRIFENLKLQT